MCPLRHIHDSACWNILIIINSTEDSVIDLELLRSTLPSPPVGENDHFH